MLPKDHTTHFANYARRPERSAHGAARGQGRSVQELVCAREHAGVRRAGKRPAPTYSSAYYDDDGDFVPSQEW